MSKSESSSFSYNLHFLIGNCRRNGGRKKMEEKKRLKKEDGGRRRPPGMGPTVELNIFFKD